MITFTTPDYLARTLGQFFCQLDQHCSLRIYEWRSQHGVQWFDCEARAGGRAHNQAFHLDADPKWITQQMQTICAQHGFPATIHHRPPSQL